jgi:hypothetical protein
MRRQCQLPKTLLTIACEKGHVKFVELAGLSTHLVFDGRLQERPHQDLLPVVETAPELEPPTPAPTHTTKSEHSRKKKKKTTTHARKVSKLADLDDFEVQKPSKLNHLQSNSSRLTRASSRK